MTTRVKYDPRTGRKKVVQVNRKRSMAAKKAARKRARNPEAKRHLVMALKRSHRTGRTKSGRKANFAGGFQGIPSPTKVRRIIRKSAQLRLK